MQLGAILELEQIEGAIAEAYRAYFAHPVLIARPSATACPNDIATPSAMVVSCWGWSIVIAFYLPIS